MEIQNVLEKALETGEVITVIYHGGSQPGTRRKITPVELYKNSIRARCYASNEVKKFLLDKLGLCDDDNITEYKIGAGFEPIPFKSIEQAAFHVKEKLEHLGWHPSISKDQICLFSHFKNGNVRKKRRLIIIF